MGGELSVDVQLQGVDALCSGHDVGARRRQREVGPVAWPGNAAAGLQATGQQRREVLQGARPQLKRQSHFVGPAPGGAQLVVADIQTQGGKFEVLAVDGHHTAARQRVIIQHALQGIDCEGAIAALRGLLQGQAAGAGQRAGQEPVRQQRLILAGVLFAQAVGQVQPEAIRPAQLAGAAQRTRRGADVELIDSQSAAFQQRVPAQGHGRRHPLTARILDAQRCRACQVQRRKRASGTDLRPIHDQAKLPAANS